MQTFKIATWNVNSLRVRLPHVLDWLAQVKPDILALQETKTPDDDFPIDVIKAAGYNIIFSGQKTYNGVAILSRENSEDIITDIPNLKDAQRRILCATIGGVRVLNIYVPNGESLESQKYQYKLNWLEKLNHFVNAEIKKNPRMIILGDFNIAPDDIDVHDPNQWQNQVLVSQPERHAFQQVLQLGFNDCYRLVQPVEQKFTWWDYRLNSFKRDLGLRIDHILASAALKLQNCLIDPNPRSWERPSDHTPVIAEFAI